MTPFLASTGAVALAEIGDKTQLLSFVLAARYRKPVPIVLGILVATLFNHALAGAAGAWVMALVGPSVLRWVIGGLFVAMAAWTLVPDTFDESGVAEAPRFGIFGTTLVAFFFAEMGDKTQLATAAMAATHASLVAIVAGSTLGMMIANVPAVLVGDRLLRRIPMKLVRATAAALFAVFGLAILAGAGATFGF
ncbi:TMEM165/GDT1 family protein [Lysobacter xanthus]